MTARAWAAPALRLVTRAASKRSTAAHRRGSRCPSPSSPCVLAPPAQTRPLVVKAKKKLCPAVTCSTRSPGVRLGVVSSHSVSGAKCFMSTAIPSDKQASRKAANVGVWTSARGSMASRGVRHGLKDANVRPKLRRSCFAVACHLSGRRRAHLILVRFLSIPRDAQVPGARRDRRCGPIFPAQKAETPHLPSASLVRAHNATMFHRRALRGSSMMHSGTDDDTEALENQSRDKNILGRRR